jgi:hypothetical protein
MKPMQISDFFDSEGRVVLYGYNHENLNHIFEFVDLPYGFFSFDLDRIVDSHTPYPINAKFLADQISKCGDTCTSIFTNRCNRSGMMAMEFYYKALLREWGSHGLVTMIPPWEGLFNRFPLGLEGLDINTNLRLVKLVDPYFVYIESHNSIELYPESVTKVKQLLNKHFPPLS